MGRRETETACKPGLGDKINHFWRYRIVAMIAMSCGFAVADRAEDDYMPQLKANTEYTESDLDVHDERCNVFDGPDGVDLTLTVEGLAEVLGAAENKQKRVLEIGPKYGFHSMWVDKELAPTEIVFCDFEQDQEIHGAWKDKIAAPNRWVYGDLCYANELLEMEKFDVVLFLGVLYHSIYPLKLLSMLNRVTKKGGKMILESTCAPEEGSVMRLRWVGNRRAKALPSVDALRVMLAWTGWSKMTRYVRYRPSSTEVLLVCEKTHEVQGDSDFCELVPPHKT